jgi:hypothetical protein
MFKKERKYVALIKERTSFGPDGLNNEEKIVRQWDMDDYSDAVNYVNLNGFGIQNYHNMSAPYYRLDVITEKKVKGKTVLEYDHRIRNFTLREDTIEKYKLARVDEWCKNNNAWVAYNMLSDLNLKVPVIECRMPDDVHYYTDFEKLKELHEAVKKEQQAFAIKGTDWPYWFKVAGQLIPSTTSNWFKHLLIKYNYVADAALEPYTGEDKYEEHIGGAKSNGISVCRSVS